MREKIYDIAISLFPALLKLAGVFHHKAAQMISGRVNWRGKLKKSKLTGAVIWVHCASLGEFEQGRPLIEKFKQQKVTCSVLVTFFSPSGYDVQKDYPEASLVTYLPFDTKQNVRDFIDLASPDIAIFIKYEFWYNYLNELHSRNIPTFLVSGIFRTEQHFFKKHSRFFKKMLSCFTHFFVQNDSSLQLLNQHGYFNVTHAGDTRFDRVTEICKSAVNNQVVEKFKNDLPLMVIGSSWPEDMDLLLPLINDVSIPCKFVIAPHEVGERQVQKLCQQLQVKWQKYSQVDDELADTRVLVVDCMGLLSSIYRYGEMAYVGGAFGDGLHNILEPATFGMPIFFGKAKENLKFQEAVDLVTLGGAFEISTTQEIREYIFDFMKNNRGLDAAAEICRKYIERNTGSTDRVIDFLLNFIDG